MNISSLQFRLMTAFVIIGLLTLSISYFNTARQKRAMAEALVESNLWDSADSYFDSVNSFMLTGLMASRHILQEKMLLKDGISEARIIRAPNVVSLYGQGHSDQSAQDDLDRRALAGEKIQRIETVDGQRTMTVLAPLIASSDFRGTDCLGCHAAKEGDILGVVRLSASMAKWDQEIKRSVQNTVLWQFLTIAAAFIALSVYIYRLILKRLGLLRDELHALEQDLDLRRSFAVKSKDEVGQLSNALHRMIQGFREHMLAVAGSSRDLLVVARQMNDIADNTEAAVSSQKEETDSVATALVEMEATAQEVKDRTAQAQDQSASTERISKQGIAVSNHACQSIYELRDHVQSASDVIGQLDQRIQSVTSVLEVISSVAEQTNLLALNAAIEAARAGEQGRGFAVVADEVRSLATRTHESTDDIKKTITALQNEAKTAVTAMNQSTEEASRRAQDVRELADKLSLIAEQVNEMNQLNTQIAQSADQQNETAGEINRNLLRIRDIAEQSEEVAELAKRNSEDLVHMAEQLEVGVSSFKL